MTKLDHWSDLTPEERKQRRRHPITLADHEARLEEGWQWFKAHPNHRAADERFDVFLGWLSSYSAACREAGRGVQEAMGL